MEVIKWRYIVTTYVAMILTNLTSLQMVYTDTSRQQLNMQQNYVVRRSPQYHIAGNLRLPTRRLNDGS
jgi:hypothetical protein